MTGSNVGESILAYAKPDSLYKSSGAADAYNQPPPISGESLQYLNGFLRTQLGRTVTVEYLVGANTLVDRTGVLLAVGANYILINEIQTDDITGLCFYNIKFIQFLLLMCFSTSLRANRERNAFLICLEAVSLRFALS